MNNHSKPHQYVRQREGYLEKLIRRVALKSYQYAMMGAGALIDYFPWPRRNLYARTEAVDEISSADYIDHQW